MKTERVFVCLYILAFILKVAHINGAGLIIIIASYALTFLYLMFGFYFFSDKSIKQQNLVLSIIAGMLFCVVPQAIMYNMLYWPYAKPLALMGIVISLIVLIISVILRRKTQENLENYYKNMVRRSAVILAVCVFFFATPFSFLVHIQYWDNPEFADIATKFYTHPEIEANRKAYDEYTATHTPSGQLRSVDMLKK